MKSLLNIKRTKEFALDMARRHRARKFTRISEEALQRWESNLKTHIIDYIHSHPSIGKTIK